MKRFKKTYIVWDYKVETVAEKIFRQHDSILSRDGLITNKRFMITKKLLSLKYKMAGNGWLIVHYYEFSYNSKCLKTRTFHS